MNIETVKGFKDFTGEEAEKREEIRRIIIENFELYGFQPAEAPIIEYKEFVEGDNSNDKAVSSIFKLQDRGKRDLALRYEFTFQLKRLMRDKKLPYKRYQAGPVFRDEPISGNRLRQFTQLDPDIIGSTIKDEAEILAVVKRILEELNIKFTIFINNRKLLNEILEKNNIENNNWENVIREIDKLDKLDENEVKENLKKFNAENLLSVFKKSESYFEKYENYSEVKELKKYCKLYNVNVKFVPSLARGLSYYNGSVFEIKSEIKETITAGGSYMFNGVQCTGISFGLERLSILTKIKLKKNKILIISISQDKKAIEISEKLRKGKIPCIIFYNKISKALDFANSYQIPFVVFIGDEEVKKKKFKLKNMNSGKEKLIGEKELIKELGKPVN
ncbi:histidine--tRNA ligase family protein [Candidatus Pacearchaeota archaeon]|nr:histidine--tRNA ligase family protein [Candidatus Pacearchaeota archaeon]